MAGLGYEFVKSSLGLQVFPVERPAVVRPVTRLESRSDELAVPAGVAPAGDDIVEHLLFALKHEGTNLQVIAAACPHLAHDLVARCDRGTSVEADLIRCRDAPCRAGRQLRSSRPPSLSWLDRRASSPLRWE